MSRVCQVAVFLFPLVTSPMLYIVRRLFSPCTRPGDIPSFNRRLRPVRWIIDRLIYLSRLCYYTMPHSPIITTQPPAIIRHLASPSPLSPSPSHGTPTEPDQHPYLTAPLTPSSTRVLHRCRKPVDQLSLSSLPKASRPPKERGRETEERKGKGITKTYWDPSRWHPVPPASASPWAAGSWP